MKQNKKNAILGLTRTQNKGVSDILLDFLIKKKKSNKKRTSSIDKKKKKKKHAIHKGLTIFL